MLPSFSILNYIDQKEYVIKFKGAFKALVIASPF